MPNRSPLVIAHRGSSASMPENTLEAFRLAVRGEGADMIEFDIHFSREGVPVVLHDARLERTTNGRGFVSQKDWPSLSKLDAAYRFDPNGDRTFPLRGRGIRIPTLEEVLSEFRTCGLALEVKPKSEDLVHAVMGLVNRHGLKEKVIVGSKHDLVSRVLKIHYPEVVRFCSRREIFSLLTDLRKKRDRTGEEGKCVASVPCRCLGISFHRKEWIDFLHSRGIRAFFWTIDEPETMRRLRDFGADGIITNHPKLAGEVLFSTQSPAGP